MPREDALAKGRRYVAEGRLHVRLADSTGIRATCRGQGELYNLGFHRGGWYCDCPAKTLCAHLVALQLVTIRPATPRDEPEFLDG